MKEAMFYEKLKDDKVKCGLCAFNCAILEGKVGQCRVRKNVDGKLYSLSYDNVVSANPDPVEKKPLYHFAPGTMVFSICTAGCNWKCKYCCNSDISQSQLDGKSLGPEDIVKMAQDSGCQGISYTYTEPTIFYELAFETARLAHQKGLYNTFVTNGYTNPKPIEKIAPYLDAVTVDFKGGGDEKFLKQFANVPDAGPIYNALKVYKKYNIHIEITDLVVPEIGDCVEKIRELVEWIADNLGKETPIHFLKFTPTYKAKDLLPTPVESLKQAAKTAENVGMHYVYIGNIADGKNNTYCPDCNALLIKRAGMRTVENNIKNGTCPSCDKKINIRGKQWISR